MASQLSQPSKQAHAVSAAIFLWILRYESKKFAWSHTSPVTKTYTQVNLASPSGMDPPQNTVVGAESGTLARTHTLGG